MSDDATAAIRRHYETYGRAFSAFDAAGAAAAWNRPSIRASTDGVAFDPAATDRTDGFAETMAQLGETDYDHSVLADLRVHLLSGRLALGNPVWDRRTADDDRIVRFSPLHLLRRTDDGWRLVARASRDRAVPLDFGPFDEHDGEGPAVDAPDDIAAFLDSYARAFGSLEADEILPAWNLPTLFVTDDGVISLPDRDAGAGFLDSLRETLYSRNYARSEVGAAHAHVLDEGLAVADVRWDRFDEAGECLERLPVVHFLRETPDGWTLVANAPHDREGMVAVGDSATADAR